MISGQAAYALWAPDGDFWSQWAKPVVFANAPGLVSDPEPVLPPLDSPAIPGTFDSTAIVVDLPGAQAVHVGLGLATRGFRPVPLFNGTSGPNPVVAVEPIEQALGAGAMVLQRLMIAPNAKPAFLLDSERGNSLGLDPGRYDNRWVILPQDLPSVTTLLSRGIKDVLLIRWSSPVPDQDLTHVLLRWREGGLPVRGLALESGKVDEAVSLAIPSGFRSLWYAALALMSLRRNSVGGFGSTIPEQTRSSGFYG